MISHILNKQMRHRKINQQLKKLQNSLILQNKIITKLQNSLQKNTDYIQEFSKSKLGKCLTWIIIIVSSIAAIVSAVQIGRSSFLQITCPYNGSVIKCNDELEQGTIYKWVSFSMSVLLLILAIYKQYNLPDYENTRPNSTQTDESQLQNHSEGQQSHIEEEQEDQDQEDQEQEEQEQEEQEQKQKQEEQEQEDQEEQEEQQKQEEQGQKQQKQEQKLIPIIPIIPQQSLNQNYMFVHYNHKAEDFKQRIIRIQPKQLLINSDISNDLSSKSKKQTQYLHNSKIA